MVPLKLRHSMQMTTNADGNSHLCINDILAVFWLKGSFDAGLTTYSAAGTSGNHTDASGIDTSFSSYVALGMHITLTYIGADDTRKGSALVYIGEHNSFTNRLFGDGFGLNNFTNNWDGHDAVDQREFEGCARHQSESFGINFSSDPGRWNTHIDASASFASDVEAAGAVITSANIVLLAMEASATLYNVDIEFNVAAVPKQASLHNSTATHAVPNALSRDLAITTSQYSKGTYTNGGGRRQLTMLGDVATLGLGAVNAAASLYSGGPITAAIAAKAAVTYLMDHKDVLKNLFSRAGFAVSPPAVAVAAKITRRPKKKKNK
jgi:hypothetical protein